MDIYMTLALELQIFTVLKKGHKKAQKQLLELLFLLHLPAFINLSYKRSNIPEQIACPIYYWEPSQSLIWRQNSSGTYQTCSFV